jgi:hypothetical protein
MQLKVTRILLAICLSGLLLAGVTVAAAPTVQVGEVTARHAQTAFFLRQLRETVHHSVAQLDTERVKGGPFVVSARLTELDVKTGELGLQATAVIETTLRDKGRGALLGMTRGRATAIAPGGNAVEAQNSAVRAAVESALKDVPAALSR